MRWVESLPYRELPPKGDVRDLNSPLAEVSEIDFGLPSRLIAEYPTSGFGITRLMLTSEPSSLGTQLTSFSELDPTALSTGQLVDSVDLRGLKDFALTLPAHLLLRELLLAEPDQMHVSEFLKKISLWLRLKPLSSIEN